MKEVKENEVIRREPSKGRVTAYIVCWLLGNGCLFGWNSLLTIEDYFSVVFAAYHPTRVFTLVYQPFALITIFILTHFEARVNTRLRILTGYSLFFLLVLLIPIYNSWVLSPKGITWVYGQLDLATSGRGGIGPYVGTCILVAGFGIADAHVQGGMFGEVSFMHASYVQAFSAGLAASGAITSAIRFICKASFPNTKSGLRKSALTFFFISAFFELLCILLYAYVFPRLQIVRYYRSRAAAEGSMTVAADLAAGGASSSEYEKDVEKPVQLQQRLTNRQLIAKNADYAFAIFVVYTLSLSIFPGFLSEDTGQHHLGSWYAITLIALFNVGDLLGRCIILIKRLRFSSRPGLVIAALSRLVFIPAFYFTAKYGSQGWMIMLCLLLGLSNGYLTVSIFVGAPKGYLGPEQNALGNILTLFLLLGLFAGVTLDWLWLIGKGW